MGSLANSSSLQTTIQDEIRCCCRSLPFRSVAADDEAKPEAEADAYYGRYGYGLAHHGHGYGLAHRGYYGAYAHPYGAYGHYYGKRSAEAEAEPTAAAEPAADAYYGRYGYGLAHHAYG